MTERRPDFDVRHDLMHRDGYTLSEVWFVAPGEEPPLDCQCVIPLDGGYRIAIRHTKGGSDAIGTATTGARRGRPKLVD